MPCLPPLVQKLIAHYSLLALSALATLVFLLFLKASQLVLPSAQNTFFHYPQNSLTSLGAVLLCPLLGQARPPTTLHPLPSLFLPNTWCCPPLSHVFVSLFDCLPTAQEAL